MTKLVTVGTEPLKRADVVAVARAGARVRLTDEAYQVMTVSRSYVEALASNPLPHYGISTGFGALATRYVPAHQRARLQQAVIRSHAAGAGPEVEAEVVRAMALLRLRTLATGRTGVRPATAAALAELLNAGLTPVVPEHGSLGCSGDLAPLAAVALALIGEGLVRDSAGELRPADAALRAAGLVPVVLSEKEGLAMINGTDGMLGMLVLATTDLQMLLDSADVTAAMSLEALLGTDAVLAPELIALRPHPGQAVSAARMRAVLAGSPIVASHRDPAVDTRVQDAYSLRCAPQVHGAARDSLTHAETVADRELAAEIDNPVVLPGGRVESTGNFHGAPLSYVLDFLAIPVADLASMAERRTDRMLDPARSHGLPPFLADTPGVDSGCMIAHYTQAALVAELKRIALPASVDSLPTSAMQEDHVSMGWAAARKLRRAVRNLATVLGIELLAAARALALRAPLRPAPATAAVVQALHAAGVAGPGPDRHLAPEVDIATEFVHTGGLLAAARGALP